MTTVAPAAPLPAHATALGKALLAFSSPDVVAAVVARGLTAYTPFKPWSGAGACLHICLAVGRAA